MMLWIAIATVPLIVICLPSLMGAIFRLAAPTADIFKISLGVGLFFAILTEAIRPFEKGGILDMINLIAISSQELLGVQIIITVVIQISVYAALAALGVKVVDRRRRARQPR